MFPTMTREEEYQCVVDDIFAADSTAADVCINDLCEQMSIANCPENAEEIMDGVIEHEDFLSTIYLHYQDRLLDKAF